MTTDIPDTPLLTAVVPVFNVRDYLLACLESIDRQGVHGLEVVVVDDGSTDESGAIADAFAQGRPGWRVLHVENGGLGRARNIGLDASTGTFVTFVDSDDIIPDRAWERMLRTITQTGSDLVSGGVLRFDGTRTRGSGLHNRAVPLTVNRTHITRQKSLMYDTTAWNKIFRRAFLVDNALRFPEGVYYEDIPLTIPAHFLAGSVDLIVDPVYLWRERQTAERSITQRRAEVQNLRDRMAAVVSVDDFLTGTQEKAGKRQHDEKVLTLDMPLFIDVLHEGDAEFQRLCVDLCADYLKRVQPRQLETLPAVRRLQYHLISRGLVDELLEAQELLRVPANRQRFVAKGTRLLADLPFRGDRRLNIPDSVYDVSRTQPLTTGIRDVRWEGEVLVVDGHAFIQRVSDAGPLSSVRRFQVREVDAPKDTRAPVRAERVFRPDVTGKTTGAPVNYDGSGFRLRVPASLLALREGRDRREVEIVAQVANRAARRGSVLGRPIPRRALHPGRARVAPDQLAIPYYQSRKLRVLVERCEVLADHPVVSDDQLRLHLTQTTSAVGPDGAALLEGAWVHLRRPDLEVGLSVPVDAVTGVVSVPLAGLRDFDAAAGDLTWSVRLLRPMTTAAAAEVLDPEAVDALVSSEIRRPGTAHDGGWSLAPLHLAPEVPWLVAAASHGAVLVQERGPGGMVVRELPAAVEAVTVQSDPDGMRLRGICHGADITSLELVLSTDRFEVPVEVAGARWDALIPATGAPGEAVLRWLRPGSWSVVARTADGGELPVIAGSRLEASLVEEITDHPPMAFTVQSRGDHALAIASDGGGPWQERGRFRQDRARLTTYRIARRMPLQDHILFEAWKGRQFSDNPRAIHDELVRRADPRRRIWVVENHGVETPDGVETVVVGSRDYFKALARSRWVVSNDSMQWHFVKREGMRYGQTWHGTPLKRIGFDIENLQMANRNYLVQFAKEVAKWDTLISPNAFSTEIFRRAFRYDGPVLETGYPRNDVFFHDAERAARVAAARRRLRLEGDPRTVVLYAPTWRDNQYDTAGRYGFSMKLDLELLHRELGDDVVLLIRGHQLVAEQVDVSLFGDFVRNVSSHPDISDLYLVADALITDYSSVMFDYVNTGRPMLFYTYDLESYRDDLRGFYFDFEAEAPGPLMLHTEEVVAALRDLPGVAATHADRYAAFRRKFASLEDGGASARFVDEFFG